MTDKRTEDEKRTIASELAHHARVAVRACSGIFKGGLIPFLRSNALWSYAARCRDRQVYGGRPLDDLMSYALRQKDMCGLGPGLFEPQYFCLEESDLPPAEPYAVTKFLEGLLARSRHRHVLNDIKTAIDVATDRIMSGAHAIRSLSEHAAAICALAARDQRLFTAALSGNLEAGRELVFAPEHSWDRMNLVRIFARQRIIWDAADIHRVGAQGSSRGKHYIAPFLRPFVRKWTAVEYFDALKGIAVTADKIWTAEQSAFSRGKEKVRLHGPKGFLLNALIPPGRLLETRLTPEEMQDVLLTRGYVHQQTIDVAAGIEARRPPTGSQQTIYQYQNAGLSEISTLFIVAYRFAEDEARMLKVIADPSQDSDLWNTRRTPYPMAINDALATRARHLVAAYRPAVLRDPDASAYQSDRINLAAESESYAHEFLVRMAPKINVPPHAHVFNEDSRAVWMFDLSYAARCRPASMLTPNPTHSQQLNLL